MSTRSVLISGSSTGIGFASAVRLAKAGWRVYAGVRQPEDGDRLLAAVADESTGGGGVVPVTLDVTNRDDIGQVLGQIGNEVGSLDGVVNNAGIAVGGPIEFVTDEQWRHQFEVNVFGLIALTRQAIPLMTKTGGRFVHIGSVSGRVAVAGLAPYAASKHALEAFNWSLRAELARTTTMTSSIVEPAAVKTPIWDKAGDSFADVEAQLDDAGAGERYQFLVATLRGAVDDGRRNGVDVDEVAEVVEEALTAARPKARYLVAAPGFGVVARLPDRALERLLTWNSRRMESKARSRGSQ